MMKKYTTSERANLFEPNVFITMSVTVEGRVDADAAVNAVKTACCANEATMSRIVLEEDGAAYYEKMQSSGCSVAVDCRDMLTIVRESEKKAFNLRKGELLRILVADVLFVPPKVSYAKEVVGVAGFGDKVTVCRHAMKKSV